MLVMSVTRVISGPLRVWAVEDQDESALTAVEMGRRVTELICEHVDRDNGEDDGCNRG
jgi:hypothetical protein